MNRNAKVAEQFRKGAQSVDFTRGITDTLKDSIRKMRGGQDHDLATGSNRAVQSPSVAPPSQSRVFKQVNRNVETGAQTILDTAVPYDKMDEAQKVEARSMCARHCKMQGRTACKVCRGAGWSSVEKTEPSRNVNRSKDVVAKSNSSEFRKV